MKNCSFLLFVLVCAPMAFAQATSTHPPASSQTPPASIAAPKAVGPEAVAERDPNKVVATVDGKQITAKQALDLLKPFPPEQRKQYESNLPNLIQQVYMRVQLADLATQMHLDQQTPWKDQIALAKENVLAQAYLAHLTEDASKGPAPDPQKYYDAHPDEFDQVALSGIFINFDPPGTPASASTQGAKTEQQAEQKADDIEKKLKAGGDFSALARAESDNKGTAAKGGDLGTYTMGDEKIPAQLRSAIGKLQAGQYSEPVRLQSAFLILKVDSRKKLAYADVQKSLEQKLKTEQSQNIVKQEIDKYKIKVEDPDFFESPSARAVPTLQRPVSAPAQPSPEK